MSWNWNDNAPQALKDEWQAVVDKYSAASNEIADDTRYGMPYTDSEGRTGYLQGESLPQDNSWKPQNPYEAEYNAITAKVMPYVTPYQTNVMKYGSMIPMIAGSIINPALGAAMAGVRTGTETGDWGAALKNAAISYGAGSVAQGASGMMSPVTESLTSAGMSAGAAQGVTNTLASTGTNAIKQYATTGSIDPTQLAVSAIPSIVNGAVNYNSVNGMMDSDSSYAEAFPASGLTAEGLNLPTGIDAISPVSGYSQPETDSLYAEDSAKSGLATPTTTPKPFDYGKAAQTAVKLGLMFNKDGSPPTSGTTQPTSTQTATKQPFQSWDMLKDFKKYDNGLVVDDKPEDNTFGLNNSFGANWYNYA